MSYQFRFFFVQVALLCIIDCGLAADLENGTLKEAQHAWALLRGEYEQGVTAEFLYTLSTRNSKDSLVIKASIDRNNDLNHTRFVDNSSDERLFAVNPDYSFQIRKPQDVWNLVDHVPTSLTTNSTSAKRTLLTNSEFIFSGILLEGGWVEDLIESDGFQIVSLTKKKIEDGGNDCIELVFKSNFTSFEKNRILSGKIMFDPSKFWVIKSYEIETDFLPAKPKKGGSPYETFKIIVNVDYQDIGGCPFPKTYTSSCIPDLQNRVFSDSVKIMVEFRSIVRGAVPDEVFRMSHYGFSEPEDPNRRLNIVRIVLMTAGVLLILFGLYLRWFAKKK